MKHSLAFALSLMLVSGTALADDRLIGADVEKALEQSSAQMNKSVEQMNAAFEKVMPELARSMAQTMSQLLESITPVMQAMENNRTFSKASEQLSKDVARSVDELNLPNTKVEQGEFLTVKGSKTVNDNSLQFDVNQNPTLVNNTAEFIRIIKAGEKIPELSLVALNDCIMSLKDFSVLDIDGSSYLVLTARQGSRFQLHYRQHCPRIEPAGTDQRPGARKSRPRFCQIAARPPVGKEIKLKNKSAAKS